MVRPCCEYIECTTHFEFIVGSSLPVSSMSRFHCLVIVFQTLFPTSLLCVASWPRCFCVVFYIVVYNSFPSLIVVVLFPCFPVGAFLVYPFVILCCNTSDLFAPPLFQHCLFTSLFQYCLFASMLASWCRFRKPIRQQFANNPHTLSGTITFSMHPIPITIYQRMHQVPKGHMCSNQVAQAEPRAHCFCCMVFANLRGPCMNLFMAAIAFMCPVFVIDTISNEQPDHIWWWTYLTIFRVIYLYYICVFSNSMSRTGNTNRNK